jgi:hypothetical protein
MPLKKVRELRDRWVEYVDLKGLPSAGRVEGKYDVRRALPDVVAQTVRKALRQVARAVPTAFAGRRAEVRAPFCR